MLGVIAAAKLKTDEVVNFIVPCGPGTMPKYSPKTCRSTAAVTFCAGADMLRGIGAVNLLALP